MDTKSKSFALVFVALFLISIIIFPSFQEAHCYSNTETFTLVPGSIVITNFELQKNDRLEGSIALTNVYSYKNVLDKKYYTYIVSADIVQSNKLKTSIYTQSEGNKKSFNYTAPYSGTYTIRYFCEDRYFLFQETIKPQVTVVANVVEATPLKIDILSPLSQTYKESNLSLSLKINRSVNWVGYSLDGKENVTLNGNKTIAELSNGIHSVTVYANDTFGYIDNQTVAFKVDKSEPLPNENSFIITVVTVSGVIVVAVALFLLLYKRHRNPTSSSK